ncbi:MAG: FlbA protein [Pirellulaceae bacterium]|nr:MAG: FlbA protein [Pirellulaceae bacterium]
MATPQQLLQYGWQVHQQKRYAEAEKCYRHALTGAPNNAAAWVYLGMALHDQRQYQQATEAYRHALALQPDFPVAWNNLGNSLRYLDEVAEADACFQRAIDLKPDYLNAYKNRGTLHVWTGRLDLGMKYYQAALQINPQEAELHRNLGVIYLLQGDFQRGWEEYRWRWRVGDLRRPTDRIPVWQGEALAGRSILLTVEQGLGDTLHFVRFARLLRAAGARVTVYCQPALLGILQQAVELGRIVPNTLPLDGGFDFQCSLIDVADVLQVNLDRIPSDIPYLQAAPHLIDYWRHRLGPKERTVRVGIAWQGNPDHQADAFRSVPLRAFAPLAEVPGVELISLQHGFGSEQLDAWQGPQPIRRLPPDVDQSSGAFMDTAAVMKNLDLVITTDTSIAHLAGALGVPTWIVLGHIPDWRWMLGRSDSPWYPTVRLFRQPRLGDWDSVFIEVATQLARWVNRSDERRIDTEA